MTTKNDVTGDSLITKAPTDAYRDGWDTIFKKKHELKEVVHVDILAVRKLCSISQDGFILIDQDIAGFIETWEAYK